MEKQGMDLLFLKINQSQRIRANPTTERVGNAVTRPSTYRCHSQSEVEKSNTERVIGFTPHRSQRLQSYDYPYFKSKNLILHLSVL